MRAIRRVCPLRPSVTVTLPHNPKLREQRMLGHAHAELEVSSEPPPAAALRLRVALMDDVPSAAVLIGHNLGIDRRIRHRDSLTTPQRFSELSKRLTHDATSPSSFANSARLAATSSDRKSTRLNSSHVAISYAVFCLKKKKNYNA